MPRTRAKTKKDPNDPPLYRWSKLDRHNKLVCWNYFQYTATDGEEGWNPASAGSVDHYRISNYIQSLGSASWFRHRAKLMVTLAQVFAARNEAPPNPNTATAPAAAPVPAATATMSNEPCEDWHNHPECKIKADDINEPHKAQQLLNEWFQSETQTQSDDSGSNGDLGRESGGDSEPRALQTGDGLRNSDVSEIENIDVNPDTQHITKTRSSLSIDMDSSKLAEEEFIERIVSKLSPEEDYDRFQNRVPGLKKLGSLFYSLCRIIMAQPKDTI